MAAVHVLKRPIAVYRLAAGGRPAHILTYFEEALGAVAAVHVLWSGAHYDLLLPAPPAQQQRSRL
jgi:OTU domain-containing protein 6